MNDLKVEEEKTTTEPKIRELSSSGLTSPANREAAEQSGWLVREREEGGWLASSGLRMCINPVSLLARSFPVSSEHTRCIMQQVSSNLEACRPLLLFRSFVFFPT